MFSNMNEEQARLEILNSISAYFNKFHNKTKYYPGARINYSTRVYDDEEMRNLTESVLDFWLTSGTFTDKFETELARFLEVNYCHFVNSGSSANLLAFMALTSPLLGEKAIKTGDEVITVSAGFPTTVAPILQFGAVPVFVDVTIPQYNIDVSGLENAVSSKTKAVILAHTMGNPFDIKSVLNFCKKYDLWLIEDNCDSLGSKYILDEKEKFTGTFGHIGTSSFYPPHHMTTGEGGAVYTNDPTLSKIIKSLRDWGRDCVCPSGRDNICNHRYDGKYGQLPQGYDHKYVYSHFGYNLKATDMQASIGLAQLKKIPSFIKKRIENFNFLYDKLGLLKDKIILPEKAENSTPSWFGFLITVKETQDRNKLVQHLENNNIQTRMLFSGNIIKHPCFDSIRNTNLYKISGELTNTDKIMNNTFWIGVYPGMTEEMLTFMAEKIYMYFRVMENGHE